MAFVFFTLYRLFVNPPLNPPPPQPGVNHFALAETPTSHRPSRRRSEQSITRNRSQISLRAEDHVSTFLGWSEVGFGGEKWLVKELSVPPGLSCKCVKVQSCYLVATFITRWWLQIFFISTLRRWSHLTSIFFRWAGSTTNWVLFHLTFYP